MKKYTIKFLSLCMTGLMLGSTFTGCGNEKKPETPAVKETQAATNEAPDSEENEDETEMSDETDDISALLKELSNYEFCFSSGVGGWRTILTVDESGYIEGDFIDDDMGDMGDDFPDGTRYYCAYEGQFNNITKIDEHTYTATISDMNYENEPGTKEIISGVRLIYSEAYGLEDPENIHIYTPGKSTKDFSEDFISWCYYQITTEDGDIKPELDCYIIYNASSGHPFVSDTVISEEPASSEEETEESKVDNKQESKEESKKETQKETSLSEEDALYQSYKKEVKMVAKKASEMDDSLSSDDLTQTELNTLSVDLYMLWDKELNQLYGYLKEILPKAEMDTLRNEERAWTTDKEKAIKEAGAEYEGGSMQPLAMNMEGAKQTKKRVYVLLSYLEDALVK